LYPGWSDCSGYADRIRELIVVARELQLGGGSRVVSNREGDSYFVEAKYIAFEGVKVSCRFSVLSLSFQGTSQL